MSLEHSPSRAKKRVRVVPEPDLSMTGWDIGVVCKFFGGSKPLDPATVYRGVKSGRFPPPYHPSPGISRWDPGECHEARAAQLKQRARPPVIA
jgi:predicted DNA-binding transcriptional regulator AlpA